MAIVIETDNQKNGLISLMGGVAMVVAVSVFAWWLFFAEPPYVEISGSEELRLMSEITDIDLSSVLESVEFKALEEHVGEIELGEFGRTNPFERF